MFNFLLNNTDYAQAIISICSIIVSIIAVIISTFTAISQIRFNKKSFFPFCQISFETIELTSTISLRNSGLGVMIVNDVFYETNNDKKREISDILKKSNYKKFLEWNYSDCGIAAGESVKLVEIVFNDYTQLKETVKLLESVTVSVFYTDIYKRSHDKRLSLYDTCKVLEKAISAKYTISITK